VGYEDFAERAGRRLDSMADRLDREAKRPGTEDEPTSTKPRVQGLRVAAQLVRDEAAAVGREERETTREKIAENLYLEARG